MRHDNTASTRDVQGEGISPFDFLLHDIASSCDAKAFHLSSPFLASLQAVHVNYRFRIQRIRIKAEPQFQLRVGMDGEKNLEYIPAYQSAFARRIPIREAHSEEVDAHLELSNLLEWLGRPRTAGAD